MRAGRQHARGMRPVPCLAVTASQPSGRKPPVGLRADERNRGCSVTATNQRAPATTPRAYRKGSILSAWLTSTDHKIIGHLYLITSFFFFLCGGLMAMIMRAQLMGPDNHIVSDQQYNELFPMHGAIMLLLFATP